MATHSHSGLAHCSGDCWWFETKGVQVQIWRTSYRWAWLCWPVTEGRAWNEPTSSYGGLGCWYAHLRLHTLPLCLQAAVETSDWPQANGIEVHSWCLALVQLRSMSWLWAWLSGFGKSGKVLWQLACYICPATETSVTSGAGLGLQWECWGEGNRERLRLLLEYMRDKPWRNLQRVYCNCADHWLHEWWNMPRFSSEQVSKPQLLLLYDC